MKFDQIVDACVGPQVAPEPLRFKEQREMDKHEQVQSEIKIICLDCGAKFTSDSVLWATLDSYSQPDEALCPECENNNLSRDDSSDNDALNFIIKTCDDIG